ncbi:unnamed protein product [Peniophora sp. CBMAI 1063]|nr:unnamed protein product [Peniophora sp. CBMAI 1063]
MAAQARSTSQTRPLNPASAPNASAGKISPQSVNSQSAINGAADHTTAVPRTQHNASTVPSSASRQASRAPPPVEDEESWPEVGKALAQPTPRPPQTTLSKSGEERHEQDEKSEASLSSGPHKKSEKPKWVPLPPEEWQAPVEPRSQRSQPHSRSSSQLPHHRHPRPSGSTNASQRPSNAASGRTSKASSVHSSPRRPQRGRALPPSFDTLGGRSAEASVHPSPRVIAETQPSYPDPSGMQPLPLQQPFYAPMPPFSPAHSPHPHQYMRSPPNGFMPPPPPPFVHSNTPPPGPYPPYPYPPYGYPYQHPYTMYGYPPPPPPGPLPPEQGGGYPPYPHLQTGPPPQASPLIAAEEPPREASLPPLTDMTRPPPPKQVDAIAGYREVGPSDGSPGAGVVFGRFGLEKSGVRSPSPVRPPLAPAQHMQAFTVGDSREDVVDRTDPDVQLSFGTLSLADAPPAQSQPIVSNGLQVHIGGAAPPGPATDSSADTWEVRDYGYGFGRASAPRPTPSHAHQHHDNTGKPRRGYGNGSGPTYGGRRGGRGAGRAYSARGGSRGPPPQTQYMPLPPQPESQHHGGLFIPPLVPPPPPFFDPYAAAGFAPPPMPPPLSAVAGSASDTTSYPRPRSVLPGGLDPLRHQLLGQLEYYLSPENFAGDLFLRKNMDARGWIPISLLASFKRVRALTPIERVVVETLMLSRIVEVRNLQQGSYVRAARGEWEPYVLPDAAESVVEPSVTASTSESPLSPANEEEEEEVEFVLSNANNATTVTAPTS